MQFLITQRVELRSVNEPLVYAQPLEYGERNAHKWVVELTDNGKPYDLTGCTATALIRRGEVTVPAEGECAGGSASVVFPPSAYMSAGPISAVMSITRGETTLCAARLMLRLEKHTTEELVDPGTVVPSIPELMSAAAIADAAALAANEAAKSARSAATAAGSESARAAAREANAAASDARAAVTLADDAKGRAEAAAASALDAAAGARAAAQQANQAASAPNQAATQATRAAERANTAAAALEDMTVSAHRAAGETPAATIGEADGHKHLDLYLVKGEKGDTGGVSSIDGIEPDGDGVLALDAVRYNAQGLTAAQKKQARQNIDTKTVRTKNLTLAKNGWNGEAAPYSVTLNTSSSPGEFSADSIVFIDVNLANLSTQEAREKALEAYSCLTRAVPGNNALTFYCDAEKPEENLPVKAVIFNA